MGQRIRELEGALSLFQSSISAEPHPLLREDLLSIKHGPQPRQADESRASDIDLADTIDAFGTLAIGDKGESRYFGRLGASEVCQSFVM